MGTETRLLHYGFRPLFSARDAAFCLVFPEHNSPRASLESEAKVLAMTWKESTGGGSFQMAGNPDQNPPDAERKQGGTPGRETVVGWLLDEKDRAHLLARFTPAYHDIVAHHVTLRSGTDESTPLPAETKGEVFGMADDGAGVQALVLSIGGTSRRADGSTYHITWSLDRARGRRAKDSNDVIAKHGWHAVEPVIVRLDPARFPATN
jgi:hypothetical protein